MWRLCCRGLLGFTLCSLPGWLFQVCARPSGRLFRSRLLRCRLRVVVGCCAFVCVPQVAVDLFVRRFRFAVLFVFGFALRLFLSIALNCVVLAVVSLSVSPLGVGEVVGVALSRILSGAIIPK